MFGNMRMGVTWLIMMASQVPIYTMFCFGIACIHYLLIPDTILTVALVTPKPGILQPHIKVT